MEPAVKWRPDLEGMLTKVRAAERETQRAKAHERREEVQLLDRYIKTGGTGEVEDLVTAVPQLSHCQASFQPLPVEHYTGVEVVVDHTAATAGLASFAAAYQRSSNLAQLLTTDWKHKNRVIVEGT